MQVYSRNCNFIDRKYYNTIKISRKYLKPLKIMTLKPNKEFFTMDKSLMLMYLLTNLIKSAKKTDSADR